MQVCRKYNSINNKNNNNNRSNSNKNSTNDISYIMQSRRFVQHAYIGDYSQGTEADLKLFHLRYQLKIARDRRYFSFLAIPAAMSDSAQAENAPK